MKFCNVEYLNSIVNVSNSILKYFNVDTFHESLSDLDKILEINNSKNVVIILYDGMGYNLINKYLPKNSFLRKNMLRSISSVVPATTTASTTSMLSGLYPCEHGWLGWDLYIPPIDKIVTMFKSTYKDSDVKVKEEWQKYYDYKTIVDLINEKSKYSAKILYPPIVEGGEHYTDIDDMNSKIIEECNKEGKKFIYAYYENPDAFLHKYGGKDIVINRTFKLINDKTEELCSKLTDTTVIVIADHGHIDTKRIILKDYPDIYNLLDGSCYIESRLCAFKVKDKEKFETLFNKYFGNDFILKTKEEVLREHLFGYGKYHEFFEKSLPDYIAIGVKDKYFTYDDTAPIMLSNHAGMCEDEMRIPLIVINKN